LVDATEWFAESILAIGMNPNVMSTAHNIAEWCDIACRTYRKIGASTNMFGRAEGGPHFTSRTLCHSMLTLS